MLAAWDALYSYADTVRGYITHPVVLFVVLMLALWLWFKP